MKTHVTDFPLAGSVESTLREGEKNGFIAAADLTSKTAAKAAVDAKQAKAHVTVKPLALPVKRALDVIDNFVTGATEGESTAEIYDNNDGIPGTYGPGFSL